MFFSSTSRVVRWLARVLATASLTILAGATRAQEGPIRSMPLSGNLSSLNANKPAAATAPDLGKKVLAFCQEQVGKKVGDGECSALAGAALASASAKGISGSSPGGDDYIWGDLAGIIETQGKSNYDRETQARTARPGDILQFRDAAFANSFAGNSSSAGHHTAVVVAVSGYGKQIQILEQNSGGRRFVTRGTLNVDEMHQGWIRIYHPVTR